jgi:GNAT superfamily N-acetyltransferase
LPSAEEIEATVERFDHPDRVSAELVKTPSWGGYWVVEDSGNVVAAGAAGAGGLTGPAVGELFVLYVDPPRRGSGAGSAALLAITDQQGRAGSREAMGLGRAGQTSSRSRSTRPRLVPRGERPAFEMAGRTSLRYWRCCPP